MTSPPEEILRDRDRLCEWMTMNPTVPLNGTDGKLPKVDLGGLVLAGAKFVKAQMPEANLEGADLTGAHFNESNLIGAHLNGATLVESRFDKANLTGAFLVGNDATKSHWGGAVLNKVTATNGNFEQAELHSARCQEGNFGATNFAGAVLTGVHFGGADLRGASLRQCEMTNTVWTGAILNAATDFSGSIWQPNHDAPNDGAKQIRLPRWRSLVNWTAIRSVGKLPLFAGSYLLLTLSLLIAIGINWINESQSLLNVTYPLPYPDRLVPLLLGSASLAVGTTIFEIACPPRVKEYTMTRWVEELRRPGVLYVSDGLQRPAAAGAAGLFVAIGGVLVGGVFLERLWTALTVIIDAIVMSA